jgi:hypothetical protein
LENPRQGHNSGALDRQDALHAGTSGHSEKGRSEKFDRLSVVYPTTGISSRRTAHGPDHPD